MMPKTILAAGLFLAAFGNSIVNFNSIRMNSIKDFLKDQVDKAGTPSIQYLFFDADSVIHESRYGLRNVRLNLPAEAATTYNLFSVSKTFTALAVLQLAQQGKIELDKPVTEYLPDFPYSSKPTVEQLLNHTAGMPNPLPLKWVHLAAEHDGFRRDAFFDKVFQENGKVKSEPGTEFSYSNLGYVILGRLIEKISGETLEAYITRNILMPVGANPSELGFSIDSATHATGYHKWFSFMNAALGFMIDKNKLMGPREGAWKPFNNFYIDGTPYGGMIGSAGGLVKYGQALLKPGSPIINDEFKRILFTESVVDGKPTGMSHSWFTGVLKGNRYFAHAGGGGGYYVELRVYPELGVGSVIMYNRSGMTDARMLDKADAFFVVDNGSNSSAR
jgi:CubicO group peptidase (beta-lactamase class C family)